MKVKKCTCGHRIWDLPWGHARDCPYYRPKHDALPEAKLRRRALANGARGRGILLRRGKGKLKGRLLPRALTCRCGDCPPGTSAVCYSWRAEHVPFKPRPVKRRDRRRPPKPR